MKKIHFKLKALEWSQHYSHFKYMGIFQTLKGSYSTVQGRIWPNFKPIQDFMGILVACNNEEGIINMKALE